MNQMKDLHREAMRLADEGDQLRRQGQPEAARARFQQAYNLERQAADLCASDSSLEPTRSVLHRSAASLALECGFLREAERLIATALSGEPPEEIAEELRDLLEEVYFEQPKPRSRRPIPRPVSVNHE